MTYEEKLMLAESMRAKSVFASVVPPDLEAVFHATRHELCEVDTSYGKAHIHIYYPPGELTNVPIYINFHGGGFVREWRENDAMFCCDMVRRTGCLCVDVDYCLSPEHPYPAPPLQAYEVICWVYRNAFELGGDPKRIAVGGHSAGANLAAVTTLRNNMRHDYEQVLQIMDYPAVDNFVDAGARRHIEGGLPIERMRQFQMLYHENVEEAKEILSSPIFATDEQLTGMPPAVVITAETDNLRDEGEAYADRLAAVGIPVLKRRFLHSRHGFAINFVDEYRELMNLYAAALNAAFWPCKP